ncbi:hypothetical protein BDP55DRAFT_416937 [Colletotrichum godetiae]|uniref:Secreted protein n=1 Tax=Colletotrichum godetiae TaxID=1209918 RepID=A0AAJ0ABC5_9PEZI|nr:uncharacterized protein BDP55DRAFT_416937 [Colletotrichum godetiae]KAK1657850.1 hypothetical protein BDP55DRAFT_416937 [Colletotrichum godetiae]
MSPRSRMMMMLMMFCSFLSPTANLPSLICIQPPSQTGQVCSPSAGRGTSQLENSALQQKENKHGIHAVSCKPAGPGEPQSLRLFALPNFSLEWVR